MVQNESAVLECVVVVPPDDNSATVGWLKVTDGSVLSTPSAGNNVFHIQHARREDSGEYRCGVSTENSGSEDADIRLVVISKSQLFVVIYLMHIVNFDLPSLPHFFFFFF